MAFKAHKNVWCAKIHRVNVRNYGLNVKKEYLAIWIFIALKKALTNNNIKTRFIGIGIWPVNFKAMQSKIEPNETFLPRNVTNVVQKEDLGVEIMEEGLLLSSYNFTHFYIDNEHEDEFQKKLSHVSL